VSEIQLSFTQRRTHELDCLERASIEECHDGVREAVWSCESHRGSENFQRDRQVQNCVTDEGDQPDEERAICVWNQKFEESELGVYVWKATEISLETGVCWSFQGSFREQMRRGRALMT
jgi:hypothetical protein